MPVAGGSSPDLSCLSIFSTESVTVPLPSNLMDFCFPLNGPDLQREGSPPPFPLWWPGERPYSTHYHVSRRDHSDFDSAALWYPEVDNELTKPVLKHLLSRAWHMLSSISLWNIVVLGIYFFQLRLWGFWWQSTHEKFQFDKQRWCVWKVVVVV